MNPRNEHYEFYRSKDYTDTFVANYNKQVPHVLTATYALQDVLGIVPKPYPPPPLAPITSVWANGIWQVQYVNGYDPYQRHSAIGLGIAGANTGGGTTESAGKGKKKESSLRETLGKKKIEGRLSAGSSPEDDDNVLPGSTPTLKELNDPAFIGRDENPLHREWQPRPLARYDGEELAGLLDWVPRSQLEAAEILIGISDQTGRRNGPQVELFTGQQWVKPASDQTAGRRPKMPAEQRTMLAMPRPKVPTKQFIHEWDKAAQARQKLLNSDIIPPSRTGPVILPPSSPLRRPSSPTPGERPSQEQPRLLDDLNQLARTGMSSPLQCIDLTTSPTVSPKAKRTLLPAPVFHHKLSRRHASPDIPKRADDQRAEDTKWFMPGVGKTLASWAYYLRVMDHQALNAAKLQGTLGPHSVPKLMVNEYKLSGICFKDIRTSKDLKIMAANVHRLTLTVVDIPLDAAKLRRKSSQPTFAGEGPKQEDLAGRWIVIKIEEKPAEDLDPGDPEAANRRHQQERADPTVGKKNDSLYISVEAAKQASQRALMPPPPSKKSKKATKLAPSSSSGPPPSNPFTIIAFPDSAVELFHSSPTAEQGTNVPMKRLQWDLSGSGLPLVDGEGINLGYWSRWIRAVGQGHGRVIGLVHSEGKGGVAGGL